MSLSSFKLNRLNPPNVSRAGDGLVVRYWTGKIGYPVSTSLNPDSFNVEEIGSRRSFCRRDFKLIFNILQLGTVEFNCSTSFNNCGFGFILFNHLNARIALDFCQNANLRKHWRIYISFLSMGVANLLCSLGVETGWKY